MKNKLYIFLLFNCILFVTSINAQIPEAGLVAYYPFTGNAKDRSGNCNNGQPYSPYLTTDRFDYNNAAYYFDGFGDYINIPGSSFENQEFTYSTWALTEDIPTPGGFFDILSIGGDDFRDQSIAIRNDGYGATSYNDDYSNFVLFAQKPAIIGQWTHLVLTRSIDKISFYVDGILTDEQKVSNFLGPFYSDNLTATIGMRHIYSNFFPGKIDDVRIYNRELTSDEVLSLYHEHFCYENITVSDTMVIKANIKSFSPLVFDINMKIYPNPNFDHLIIDAGDLSGLSGYLIKITNASGVKVFQSEITQQIYDLDMNKWKGKGLYFLYLYDSNANIVDVKKIVVQ